MPPVSFASPFPASFSLLVPFSAPFRICFQPGLAPFSLRRSLSLLARQFRRRRFLSIAPIQTAPSLLLEYPRQLCGISEETTKKCIDYDSRIIAIRNPDTDLLVKFMTTSYCQRAFGFRRALGARIAQW